MFKTWMIMFPLLFNSVETFAAVRNIEDPAAEKITPIIPPKILQSVPSEILSSKIVSALTVSVTLQSFG